MTTGGTMTVASQFATVGQIRQETLEAVNHAIITGDPLVKDLAIAKGLADLRAAFRPELVAMIVGLGGTSLGYRHDMESRNGSYPHDVVRDCAIEALLRGVSLTGNQFNIIAGRCYITREGYNALLLSYPGLTSLEKDIGVPQDGRPMGKQELVFVAAAARCKVNGKLISVECRKDGDFDGRLAVKTFAGEIDNAKGKAERRLLKLLYERVTGSVIDEPDDGVEQGGSVRVIENTEDAAEASTETADPYDVWESEKAMLESPRAKDAWDALASADNAARVEKIMRHAAKEDMTVKDRQSLQRFADFIRGAE